MIPAIVSIILLAFLWLGDITEARHANLRQQHVTARNELTARKDQFYTSCQHLIMGYKTCAECIKSKGGWWLGEKRHCVWKKIDHKKSKCVEANDETTSQNGWKSTPEQCLESLSSKSSKTVNNWMKQKGKQLKPGSKWKLVHNVETDLEQDTHLGAQKAHAGVHPSMKEFDSRVKHTQAEFQKLSGNNGYCWRYASSQGLGVPFLVFEQMVKTIQSFIKAHSSAIDAYEAADLTKSLGKPLSYFLEDWRGKNHITKFASDAQNHSIHGVSDTVHMMTMLKWFAKKYNETSLYEEKFKGSMEAAKQAKLSAGLRKLIKCVHTQSVTDPSLEKINEFLTNDENGYQRRVYFEFRMYDATVTPRKPRGGHVAVLLRHTDGKIYYADGNGFDLDGQLLPWDENCCGGHDLYTGFKKWVDGGHNNTAGKYRFTIANVDKDNC